MASMSESVKSNTIRAFEMLIQAARQYSGAEYKFYDSGFFKYVKKGDFFFIEDIYIIPEHRGTPVSSIILEQFEQFMKDEDILGYYGNVYKANTKALEKFKAWGMVVASSTEEYDVVFKRVRL